MKRYGELDLLSRRAAFLKSRDIDHPTDFFPSVAIEFAIMVFLSNRLQKAPKNVA
jgi:hypothetical protein